MRRSDMIDEVSARMVSALAAHTLRVAIDGIDAAGKTTLADELARSLNRLGRVVIRAGIDGFHNPIGTRHQQTDLAAGYYEDSFNYVALKNKLLIPLGPGGSGICSTAVYDYRIEDHVESPPVVATRNSILLFDGVFLLRKELLEYWDMTIFVDITFRTQMRRALTRDRSLFGTPQMIRNQYRSRYVPGQKLYLRTEHPKEKANIIITNDKLENPWVRYSKSLEQVP